MFANVLRQDADATMTAALLAALAAKGETVDELEGGARFLRDQMTPFSGFSDELVDTCGTGGSGLHTYNISTASAVVAAAAGVKIAKHGNRAVSSKSGSSDVLSALGIDVGQSPERAAKVLEKTGITFLFAPSFHPVVRFVAPIRAALGIRTIFNMVGPLANPAGARRQIIGVYAPPLVDRFAQTLARLGTAHSWVVHGNAGEDEISLAGPTEVAEIRGQDIRRFTIAPDMVGIDKQPVESVFGGTPDDNAAAMRALFDGVQGPYHDSVVMNAGAAIYLGGKAANWQAGVETARAVLRSGAAATTLDHWVRASQAMTL